MSLYDEIFKDVKNLIKKYDTRDPKEILIQKGVTLLAFKDNTKLLGMYKIIKKAILIINWLLFRL